MDHVPVAATLGQVDSHLLNTGYFQKVDTTKLFENVAVYNKLVTSPETLPASWVRPSTWPHQGVAVLIHLRRRTRP